MKVCPQKQNTCVEKQPVFAVIAANKVSLVKACVRHAPRGTPNGTEIEASPGNASTVISKQYQVKAGARNVPAISDCWLLINGHVEEQREFASNVVPNVELAKDVAINVSQP